MSLDALVIAAHPDDAEISVGGTILRWVRAGKRVGVLDLTRGEMGTRGTAEGRAREASAASEVLGLALRENLELPDGRVEASLEAREALAARIRAHAPHVVLAHHDEDLHPDHVAAGRLARQAWYLAGLARLATPDSPAYRPPRLLHFPGHLAVQPTFVVDVGPVWEAKCEAVRAYASQLEPEGEQDNGSHFLFGADILARMETKARYWGEQAGVRYGEALQHPGPVPMDDPMLNWL
jgi:bacillithiol biosynthesis deacetylase BshB1